MTTEATLRTGRDVQNMLNNEVQYKDWRFNMTREGGELYLQVAFVHEGAEWKGRKWRLSQHMKKSEIVQTALKAVLTAEEHEAREQFLYKGKAVFGPHIDVDALWEVCETLDARDAALAGAGEVRDRV